MGKLFFLFALLLFFFDAVGVGLIPHPAPWGFVSLAAGCLSGDFTPWRKAK